MKLATSKGSRAEKQRPRKRKWPWVLALCLLPFTALAVFWFSNVKLPDKPWEFTDGIEDTQSLPNAGDVPGKEGENAAASRAKGVYTFLLCGTDKDKTRTDTIMVASLDIVNNKIGLVSIPRDTYIPTATRSVKKINGAYAGNNMDRLLDEVKTVVGFRPDYWMLVDFDGFVKLVDAMNGIDFYVPVDLKVNTYQSVTREISKGMQHLDGTDALGVVRHRKAYATQDLQRTSVQRDMLKALAQKMFSTISPKSFIQYKDIVAKSIQTDLSWGEITALAIEAAKVDLETNFASVLIPTSTKSGTAYEAVKTKEALELINSTINPYDRPITEADLG